MTHSDSPIRRLEAVLRRAFPWLVGAAVVGLLVLETRSRSLLSNGASAPGTSTRLSDGSTLDVAAEPGVVVLNFWASWCPPCRAEAPALTAVHERMVREGKGRVVALSVEEGPLLEIARGGAELGLAVPIGIASPDSLAHWRVTSMPTTYVVAKGGAISRSFVGEVEEDELNEAVDEAAMR